MRNQSAIKLLLATKHNSVLTTVEMKPVLIIAVVLVAALLPTGSDARSEMSRSMLTASGPTTVRPETVVVAPRAIRRRRTTTPAPVEDEDE